MNVLIVRLSDSRDHALPEAVEPQEKFDLLGALHGPGEFHGSFATRAFEWVATQNLENQVAPEGAHVAGGLFRGCRDEEDFGGRMIRSGMRGCWPQVLLE